MQEEGNGLRDERGGLSRDVQEMEALPGPAHVQGAIEEAQAELDDVHRAHDRLALLATAISAAERAYRDENQSPLLESASAYLASITDGRYDRLIADDSTGDGVRLHVRRRGEDFPVVVGHPLSRGTLQQIYLALRLAMVDQVEGEDAERLPLFLDEMFVNWDPSRTRPRDGRAARDRPITAGVSLHRRSGVGGANQRPGRRGRGRHTRTHGMTSSGSPWPRWQGIVLMLSPIA